MSTHDEDHVHWVRVIAFIETLPYVPVRRPRNLLVDLYRNAPWLFIVFMAMLKAGWSSAQVVVVLVVLLPTFALVRLPRLT